MNLYNIYQYNIYILINKYKIKYSWINLQDFLNYRDGQGWSQALNFSVLNNPWLQKYRKKQKQLGQDILQQGTFTPIFTIKSNNFYYVMLGRHRVASLILNYLENPLKYQNHKILCIEISSFNFDVKFLKYNLLLLNNKKVSIKNIQELYSFLLRIGDGLTPYLWENKCKPFAPFNDEKLFEEWLNGPEPTIE